LFYQGEFNAAEQHLEIGLNLAQETSQLHFKNAILLSLVDCFIRQKIWDKAGEYLRKATPLTDELQDESSKPLISLGWAQIQMARGQAEEALKSAQQAVQLNRDLGDVSELGISLRILGQALVTNNEHQQAIQVFEESVSVLGDQHPYETAQTWMQWGECLRLIGQEDAGRQLLKEAQQTFERLGAKGDLLVLNQIPGYE